MLTCDHYITARTLDAAFDAMEAFAGRYRLVAGATDILPWAREGRAGDVHIEALIDISKIADLKGVVIGKSRVRLGAATPFQAFLEDRALSAVLPNMRHCAIWFACDQIRASATIGGNVANASPAADGMPALLVLNAEVELALRDTGGVRRRSVPLAELVEGPSRTSIAPGEIITSFECDALPTHGGAFEKVGHRRSLVIAVACLSVAVSLDAGRKAFDDVRIAAGGIGPKAVRLAHTEALLRGAPLDAGTIAEAAELELDLVQSRSRRDYRRAVLRGFLTRALVCAAREAGADVDVLEQTLEAVDA